MTELKKWVAAGAVALAAYFAIGSYFVATYAPVQGPLGTVAALKPPFDRHFAGGTHAFTAQMPALESYADRMADPRKSPFVIYEGDTRLGPAHSQHRDIDQLGEGRFSHWSNVGFIFSTSDNRNPMVTGRRYWIVKPKT